MKYCPYCGNALNDDMRFCNVCGKAYSEAGTSTRNEQVGQDYSQPITKPKDRHVLRNILIVLGVLALVYIGGAIIGALINNAYYNANESEREKVLEEQYDHAVNSYDRNHYDEALNMFATLDDDYKSTHLYKILCNGHIHHHLPDEDIRELKNNLDFADTKSLLLSDTWLAVSFLDGYWRSENKKYNLEVYDQGDYTHVSTNLPYKQVKNEGEGFYIEDGVYGHYLKNKDEASANEGKHDMYRFSILGADKIAVVCLKDDTRIIMIRE